MTDKHPPAPPMPTSLDEAHEVINILREELAAVCVAVGRSKDGTGYDVDWFELHKDAAPVSETQQTRDAVLEKAARACEARNQNRQGYVSRKREEANACAADIRALKSAAPQVNVPDMRASVKPDPAAAAQCECIGGVCIQARNCRKKPATPNTGDLVKRLRYGAAQCEPRGDSTMLMSVGRAMREAADALEHRPERNC